MKKFKSLLLMAVLLVLAVSCGKKHEITLSPTEFEFEPTGGEVTVEINTDGDWNVENAQNGLLFRKLLAVKTLRLF